MYLAFSMFRKSSVETGLLLMLMLVLSVLILPLRAQKTGDVEEQSQKAPVEVLVTDMENNPRKGEEIVFIDTLSQEKFSGVTHKNGKFQIKLPGGNTYMVKIKGVGADQKYTLFTLPELQENEVYSKSRFRVKYEPPQVFRLDNVYFDVNKATLREASYQELDELVAYMKRREHIRVEVAGHTDNVGSKKDNLQLSRRRARRVKKYLINQGIDADRIEARGYGEDRPIAGNNTKEGRQKNRRTEVHIIKE